MLEPNCRKVVETKNLWSIAIDFMKNIDDKLMEFNLKFAYITYMICKLSKVDYKTKKHLVFISCFNNVGKHYEGENASNPTVETYLFLKYFSPIKNDADLLLPEILGSKNLKNIMGYNKLKIAKKFTQYLVSTNDSDEALRMIMQEDKKYGYLDIVALNRLVKKTDLFYYISFFLQNILLLIKCKLFYTI